MSLPIPLNCAPEGAKPALNAILVAQETNLAGPLSFYVVSEPTALEYLARRPNSVVLDYIDDIDPQRSVLRPEAGARVYSAFSSSPPGDVWWMFIKGLEKVQSFQEVLGANFLNQALEFSPTATLRMPEGTLLPLRDVRTVLMSETLGKAATKAAWETIAAGHTIGEARNQRLLNLDAVFNRVQVELPRLPSSGWEEAFKNCSSERIELRFTETTRCLVSFFIGIAFSVLPIVFFLVLLWGAKVGSRHSSYPYNNRIIVENKFDKIK